MTGHFKIGQRVRVHRSDTHGEPKMLGGAEGSVVRLRRGDEGAWVRLDVRSPVEGAHPFPADDPRGRDVLAYPVHCSPV